MHYAHSKKLPNGEIAPKDQWEPLFTPFGEVDLSDPTKACSGKNGAHCPHCEALETQHGHLNKVASLAAKLAGEMFPPTHPDHTAVKQWAFLTGLWHDLGKFSQNFQSYLEKASDPHNDEILEKVDHTTAGAKHATERSPLGHFIANAIAGHHAGLLDTISESASLDKRLKKQFGKDLPAIDAPEQVSSFTLPQLPSFLANTDANFATGFFQRMLFSCLVDADFLATESFMNQQQATCRPEAKQALFHNALDLLTQKINSFGSAHSDDKVALARAQVVSDCSLAAESPSGIFTLTVPTGGGKTLSSLNFALQHAIKYEKKKIIYVIPFTSIIEQNASVFSELLSPLGNDVVLEHHSNLSPEKEEKQTSTSRLASENWDAPIIVTTAVQFYESLFASKTSRSRKIHNISNSVVILDEAQCLPVNYLTPCLKALQELSSNYNTTTVLCTATQPSVAKSENFPIGFDGSTEIIQNTERLFEQLERTEVLYREKLSDNELSSELDQHDQVLCIVNTRGHAQSLYESLTGCDEENFHLSTLMCPKHRLEVLAKVRERLAQQLPVRLVSTQLIEAGVDVDFPVVYRSMAGLDSIAQAAGRCNREGKLNKSLVHVFHSEHLSSERYFAETANIGHEILDLHSVNPLSTEAIQSYFNKYYYQQKPRWDAKYICSDFSCKGSPTLPLLMQYKTAAEKFTLIENSQIPIIVPINDEAKQLCEELRNESIPLHRQLLRNLQQFTVQIYDNQFRENYQQFEVVRDGQFHILICPETHYSESFGLSLNNNQFNTPSLIY